MKTCNKAINKRIIHVVLNVGAIWALAIWAALPVSAGSFTFNMVRSPALTMFPNCAPNATATVTITAGEPADTMDIFCSGLPPNIQFDVFVIQVANSPFGLCWYQGDLQSGPLGNASARFIGRFSIETFIVAPGVAPAPVAFATAPFPSVAQNPQTGPVQTYHLGVWFDKPSAAVSAGGPNTVTPFNGQHNAGVQILNTSNFPNLGPLSAIRP
jgi:hypothetical protein